MTMTSAWALLLITIFFVYVAAWNTKRLKETFFISASVCYIYSGVWTASTYFGSNYAAGEGCFVNDHLELHM